MKSLAFDKARSVQTVRENSQEHTLLPSIACWCVGLQAAFQALKFGPKYLTQFAQLDTGDEAFRLKRRLESQGLNDPTFGGRGNNWAAMFEVLRSKLSPQFENCPCKCQGSHTS